MQRRQVMFTLAATGAVLAAGCSGVRTVSSTVSSYGDWPQDRPRGRYAIERLPSQQAAADRMEPLEAAAHAALARAGFERAADESQADVVVQLGARITRYDVSPWDDPLWWRWGPTYWRSPAWRSRFGYHDYPGAWRLSAPPNEREVALLLRDRRSARPLYEARAVSSGFSTEPEVLSALFQAALSDFPAARPEPHTVTTVVTPLPR